MNWINIETATIDSEEFLGASPVERATWLCLLRYCVGQENGGRIEAAKEWKDRKWQQIVRVTIKEVNSKCDLWSWDGEDLVVEFYPVDKEEEVRRNRENGAKGGRPRKANPEPKQNHPVSESETTRFDSAKTERKGKEENGKEGNPPNPHRRPTIDQALSAAQQLGIRPAVARCWWETREASGWIKGTTGGNTPVGPNWQADLKQSVSWAEEKLAKAKQSESQTSKPNRCV